MMCARLLRATPDKPPGRLSRAVEQAFSGLAGGYQRSLAWALDHGWLIMIILAGTIALNIWLYVIVPKGFFPQQDTGRIVGGIQADQSISFQAMRQKLADFVNIVRQDPAVDAVVAFTGGGQLNSARMFIGLKPLAERGISADDVIARLRGKLAREPGASLFLQPVQDIRVGGRASNAQYQYTLQADDLNELNLWEPRIRQALSELPELADVNTDQQDKGIQTRLLVDRDAAARLGISMNDVDTTLNNLFGQRQVSTIYNPLNQYRVVMEAAPEYWQSPETLRNTWVITSGGDQVPLSAFSRLRPEQHAAGGQPPGPVRRHHDFLQPAGRRLAVDGNAGDRQRAGTHRRAELRSRASSRARPARFRIRSPASRGCC